MCFVSLSSLFVGCRLMFGDWLLVSWRDIKVKRIEKVDRFIKFVEP